MRTIRGLRLIGWASVAGLCFQAGGCGVGTAARFLSNLNPCGTILNCDPVLYQFISSGYRGPGADPAIDPACTFPPFCDEDPFVGGGGGE